MSKFDVGEAEVALMNKILCLLLEGDCISPSASKRTSNETPLSIMVLSAAASGCMHDSIVALTT